MRAPRSSPAPLAVLGLLFGPVLGLGALASGCPGTLQPPGPGEGTPCDALEDCNPGRGCGDLFLCVDGLCEETASLVRPCPGEGVPPTD